MVPSLRSNSVKLRRNLPVVGVLLLAALMRWHSLEAMSTMLHHDEAYNGVDALRLAADPFLTVFFPDNFGREAGWIYWLWPFVRVLGAHPLALRLGATFMGVLGVAATFRLGTELLGRRGGLWAALALAVLYWHVHLSALGLRAIMMPFVGAMTFASLLRAQRTGEQRQWLAAGIWLGALAYTYFAARSWILLALLALGWWFLRERARRRQILGAAMVAALLALPLVVYSLSHPAGFDRMGTVAAGGAGAIWANTLAWLRAWFQAGDENVLFNTPGRPVLDPFLGVLFLLGLAGFPFVARRRRYALWPLALLFFALLPSLLSDFAPHFLRALGAVVPVALLVGGGARVLETVVGARVPRVPAGLLPLLLLLGAGTITFRAFHGGWVRRPDLYLTMEQHIYHAVQFVEAEVAPGSSLYFSPFAPDHPNLRFFAPVLGNYQVGAFDSHQCLLVADGPAVYTTLTTYEPAFAEEMAPFMALEAVYEDRVAGLDRPAVTIYRGTPRPVAAQTAAVFGEQVQAELLTPLPATAEAGSILALALRLRAVRQLDTHYNVFIHLYTVPPPEEGGSLVAQADEKLCPAYPTPAWKLNESAIEQLALALPAGLPAGEYLVGMGVYESWPPYTRLPLTGAGDYLPLGVIQVGPPEAR